jgi:hypothetical protein
MPPALVAATISSMSLQQERTTDPGSPWMSVLVVLGLVLAGIAEVGVSLVAIWIIAFGTQGSCYDPASMDQLWQARLSFAILTAVCAGPWLLAALLIRKRRTRWWLLVEAAVVGLAPGYFLVFALLASPADWTSGFCF